ncbi:hypothetical protein ACEPAH_9626 [Sanghuangporus vaninii]
MALLVRDDSQLPNLSTIKDIVSENRTAQYCQIALVALLIYDSLITFDREVEYFWRASFRKPATLIYFMLSLKAISTNETIVKLRWRFQTFKLGEFSNWSINITTAVVIISIDFLAFYSQHKMFSLCLKILLTMEVATKIIATIYGTYVSHTISSPVAEGITVCVSKGYDPTLVTPAIVDWSLPMSFGLILMGLILYKAAEYWKISTGFKGFELIKVLIRDQVVYFSALIVFCALNIAYNKLEDLGTSDLEQLILQEAGMPAYLSILGSRMLFNLKEAGKRGLNEGTNYWLKSLSNIEFYDANAPEVAGTFSDFCLQIAV